MRTRRPEPTQQRLVFARWKPDPKLCGGGTFETIPLDLGDVEPRRVWTLYYEQDEASPPTLPYRPVHNHNAFSEDAIHDWDYDPRKKELCYYTRVMDRSVWILVEF